MVLALQLSAREEKKTPSVKNDGGGGKAPVAARALRGDLIGAAASPRRRSRILRAAKYRRAMSTRRASIGVRASHQCMWLAAKARQSTTWRRRHRKIVVAFMAGVPGEKRAIFFSGEPLPKAASRAPLPTVFLLGADEIVGLWHGGAIRHVHRTWPCAPYKAEAPNLRRLIVVDGRRFKASTRAMEHFWPVGEIEMTGIIIIRR